MPTYDYKCLECDYTFEYFQKITDEPIKVCPECKGKVKRMIGPGAGPIFKGSGFYQTDYKTPPEKSKTVKDSSEKKDSKTTKEKKSKKDND